MLVPLVILPHRVTYMYCVKEEIPVAGRLVHFLPFWEEVIEAEHWVLWIICQGCSITLIQPPQFQWVRSTPIALERP